MNGTVITKKGLMLITKLLASRGELTFSKVGVGIGNVPSGYDPSGMMDLNNYKMDGEISEIKADAERNQASIRFQVSSVGVTEAFTVTEAGVYAQDPDEGEILYAYLDMSDDPQMIYDEESTISKFLEMTLVVVVGTVERITAIISPQSLISKEEFDKEMEILREEKVNIVVADKNIPIAERKEKTFYFVKNGTQPLPTNDTIKISPYVGVRIVEKGNKNE